MIRIATRGSKLALAQAGQVAEMLGGAELVEVGSDGGAEDKARFVHGVEQALLDGEAEIGVHSAKDLPAELTEGLMLAAVPEREDARDAWVGVGSSLDEVPEGAKVGTASLRRQARARWCCRSAARTRGRCGRSTQSSTKPPCAS